MAQTIAAERRARLEQPWRDLAARCRDQTAALRHQAANTQVPTRGYAPPPRTPVEIATARRDQEAARVALVRGNATKLDELAAQDIGFLAWLLSSTARRRRRERRERAEYARQALNAAEAQAAHVDIWLDSDAGHD